MGAWGTKVFESDESFEFLEDFLEGNQNIKILQKAFDNILNELNDIDPVMGEGALAAAEIIAISKGNTYKDFDNDSIKKIDVKKLKRQIDDKLITDAINAIDKVKDSEKSELRELWEDSGEYEEWEADLEDLKKRLKIENQ